MTRLGRGTNRENSVYLVRSILIPEVYVSCIRGTMVCICAIDGAAALDASLDSLGHFGTMNIRRALFL